tara:strand:- start:1144 stop:1881 length:738 start_codon:yes stop_codon:yes gene_type:complete
MTDVGVGFLKGIGNPQGTQALACELVGTELAAWFGLDTVEFSLINVKDDDVLPLHNVGRTVQAGPAFICKLIDGDTWDGGDVYLSRLQSPSVVTKLIIFDTWIMNPDRYPPRGSLIPTPENRDNILFEHRGGGRFKLIAFDHTHCFAEGDIWEELGNNDLISDDRVFGFFPEFAPYIERECAIEAARKLRGFNRETAVEIVNSVPREWGITGQISNQWADLIYLRSRFVADTILGKILSQGELDV